MTTPTLVHEDLVRERDRLRDARRGVTSQLGPVPAASAVVIGLFGALSDDINDGLRTFLYGLALALFLVMVIISAKAITHEPYRTLRKGVVDRKLPAGEASIDQVSEAEWLAAMISVERELKGQLEDAFDTERRFLLAVQWLFLAQILVLGLITLLASGDMPSTL